ncbi:MAG: hypothetical protein JNL90_12650 [Planctomycetes bacterium]|nr:hypothetical protein [Planctomycetota bacterium]
MSRRLPWIRFWAPNWLADGRLLSTEARAALIDVLALTWHHGVAGKLTLAADAWSKQLQLAPERLAPVLAELTEREHVESTTIGAQLALTCPELVDAWNDRDKEAGRGSVRRRAAARRPPGRKRRVHPDESEVSDRTNGECPAEEEEEVEEDEDEDGAAEDSLKTDAQPSAACLAPSASAVALASTPKPRKFSAAAVPTQPEPPNDLRPFERWWKLDAVPPSQWLAQAKFVEGAEALLSALDAAFPQLDLDAELAKAFAWEVANPSRQKTPRGRAAFLRSWMDRAQNKGAPR